MVYYTVEFEDGKVIYCLTRDDVKKLLNLNERAVKRLGQGLKSRRTKAKLKKFCQGSLSKEDMNKEHKVEYKKNYRVLNTETGEIIEACGYKGLSEKLSVSYPTIWRFIRGCHVKKLCRFKLL